MKRKILVVDDAKNVQALLSDFLNGQSFEVLLASDGRQALEVVRTSCPDLVLLDIMMPNMDGYQFISQLRRESSLPVIMVTAKQQEMDIIRGFELGADDYITKPFRMRELLARIHAVLRRAYGKVASAKMLRMGDLVVDGETGYLVPVKDDMAAFTAKMIKLALEPEMRQRMGVSARQAARAYEIDRTVQEMVKRYISVVENSEKRRRGWRFTLRRWLDRWAR